ncbi:hypothetical protein KIW84_071052 [Lathyrus oleraceus]|uniref:DUF4283 domain-containing protein n=1 Tax=Pisum sativum TaxID=3888 RepID=A0A9D4VJQ3_PEA|nr:hypothetical protein KIW84_071052 [Pisum sativum]
MDKLRNIPLSKEEEEGVVAAEDEVSGEEIFQRTLAGKLWTDNSFNVKAFTSTMISAWKLKNSVKTQELSKNIYLFRFASKRDLEFVLRNAPPFPRVMEEKQRKDSSSRPMAEVFSISPRGKVNMDQRGKIRNVRLKLSRG